MRCYEGLVTIPYYCQFNFIVHTALVFRSQNTYIQSYISSCLCFRRLDSIKRKERNEAHLYFQVEVYIDEHVLVCIHTINGRCMLKDIFKPILGLIQFLWEKQNRSVLRSQNLVLYKNLKCLQPNKWYVLISRWYSIYCSYTKGASRCYTCMLSIHCRVFHQTVSECGPQRRGIITPLDPTQQN